MCADMLMQPFIDGLQNGPDRKKDINKIRNWYVNLFQEDLGGKYNGNFNSK